jgi:hypothetical protein
VIDGGLGQPGAQTNFKKIGLTTGREIMFFNKGAKTLPMGDSSASWRLYLPGSNYAPRMIRLYLLCAFRPQFHHAECLWPAYSPLANIFLCWPVTAPVTGENRTT